MIRKYRVLTIFFVAALISLTVALHSFSNPAGYYDSGSIHMCDRQKPVEDLKNIFDRYDLYRPIMGKILREKYNDTGLISGIKKSIYFWYATKFHKTKIRQVACSESFIKIYDKSTDRTIRMNVEQASSYLVITYGSTIKNRQTSLMISLCALVEGRTIYNHNDIEKLKTKCLIADGAMKTYKNFWRWKRINTR